MSKKIKQNMQRSVFKHRSCDGKNKYSYGLALCVADKTRRDSGTRLRIYKCYFCSKYHLSSKEYYPKEKHLKYKQE